MTRGDPRVFRRQHREGRQIFDDRRVQRDEPAVDEDRRRQRREQLADGADVKARLRRRLDLPRHRRHTERLLPDHRVALDHRDGDCRDRSRRIADGLLDHLLTECNGLLIRRRLHLVAAATGQHRGEHAGAGVAEKLPPACVERNLVIAIVAGHGIPLRSGLFPGPAKGALFNRLFNRLLKSSTTGRRRGKHRLHQFRRSGTALLNSPGAALLQS